MGTSELGRDCDVGGPNSLALSGSWPRRRKL